MKKLRKKAKRAVEIFRDSGIAGIRQRIYWILRYRREAKNYQKWMLKFGTLNDEQSRLLTDKLEQKPLISIILPVYNIDEKWLRLCIDSVLRQIYSNWELCIADDCSTSSHIRPILEEYAAQDGRVKMIFRSENGHISAASNSALELAAGEFCVLLDHDDELSNDALLYVAQEINEHPDVRMIYSDDNLIDTKGRRSQPLFKPDFSRDLLYSLNLVTHLSAYRTDLLREIGGFRVGLEGSQDYDLALRVIERIDESKIRHIPRMLYHWRTVPGSVALDGGEKPYAHERARQAIREHFERTGVNATVEETHFNLHRVRYALPEKLPVVSVIFWSGDESADNSSIYGLTSNFDENQIEIIDVNDSGNLAATMNSAVSSSIGDVIVFLRSGVVPHSESPLDELACMALQPKIGAVGGVVIGKDGTVRAGGIVIDANGLPHIAHGGFPQDVQGNLLRNMLIGNFSAVCFDAFAIGKDVFLNAGALDEKFVDKDLLAADLCLRLSQKGYRIALTPYAKFVLSGQTFRSQISFDERSLFVSRWAEKIKTDPFSNSNLTSDGLFSIKI